ncbi:MAG: type I-E CRISPR-associated protein Cse1/CasA, partial [Porticoccaceae bacterium]|nr:type I-E CRISPR-associated protein Cse1/CasA [Porticoccaceae bacterium]
MDEAKTMNLISDQWLPVRERNGQKTTIKIAEIAGENGHDIVEIIALRADFKGAIYQLLIGILQTAFAPKDSREWKKYWRNPPSQAELEQAFKRIEPAFDLNTENGTPAFMQDFDLPYEKKDVPVGKILIEAPGENTVKHNIDHFIKRDFVNCISSYWAAVALFTLQINGPPSGG